MQSIIENRMHKWQVATSLCKMIFYDSPKVHIIPYSELLIGCSLRRGASFLPHHLPSDSGEIIYDENIFIARKVGKSEHKLTCKSYKTKML